MCKVTLSFDRNNEVAKAKLAALLSTGLFVQVDKQDDVEIDHSDPMLFEEDFSLPQIDKDLTPEELRALLITDLNSVYGGKDAV